MKAEEKLIKEELQKLEAEGKNPDNPQVKLLNNSLQEIKKAINEERKTIKEESEKEIEDKPIPKLFENDPERYGYELRHTDKKTLYKEKQQ